MAKYFLASALLVVLSTTSTLGQQTCPPGDVEISLPHRNCSKFIVCSLGIGYEFDCPLNLYFNELLGICDWPENVGGCEGGTAWPPEPTTPEPNPNLLTKCGDTIVANTGRIEYKFEEAYEANEICSFVIRPEQFSSGIVFTLDAHGFNATADPSAITILTFGSKGHVETSHLGPPNPLTEAYVSGSVAVVVFKTTGNRGTGFKLSFNAVPEANYFFTGVNLVYSNLTGGEITIPFWEDPAYMTSVIVLSANHKKIVSSFDSLRLTFLKENLEKHLNVDSCGYDAIHVYSFLSGDVRQEGTFCSLLTQKSVYETTGILILIFRDFDSNYWYDADATFKWEIVSR